MESKLGRLLDALPAMVWTAGADGITDFVNDHWRDYTGLSLEEATSAGWSSVFHPEDFAAAQAAWLLTQDVAPPTEIDIEARLRRHDGVYRRFTIQTRRLHDDSGAPAGWCGINTDVEHERQAEAQLAAEKRLLELVALGVDLASILEELCVQVEGLSEGSLCSILYVDEGQQHFWVAAGNSIPDAYNAVLDGLRIDPAYGPCSLAVTTRSTVIAPDPARDPRWSTSVWPSVIEGFGLASCWSAPIFVRDEVAGIFAIYKREPQGPTDADQELIDRFAKIAGIAMERSQSDLALNARANELRRAYGHLAQAQSLSRTGSFTTDTASESHHWSEELHRILAVEPGGRTSLSTLTSMVHDDDRRIFESAMARARAGADVDIVFRVITRVGASKYLHAVIHSVKEPTTTVMLGSIQDVTDSKLAEEALKANEQILRRANRYLSVAQRLSKTGSFTWNVDSDEQDWSDELYRIWEIDPTDDHPVPWLHATVLHPDDVDGVEAIQAPAFEAGEGFEVSYRIITRSGLLKYLHTVNERVAEIPDQLVYIGATQDLTESKRAEEALRASEAQLRRANRYLRGAQTLSRIGSFTLDLDTDDQDWSEENYRIWEFDPSVKPTLAMVMEAIHPEDRPAAAKVVSDALATGAEFELFYRIVTPKSGIKHVHTIATRIPEYPDRLIYIGSTQDVTASKLAEAELAMANTYLISAQRLTQTGSFTWDVAADHHQWSDVIYDVFGFDPGVSVTMDMMLPAIHPEDLPQVEALIRDARIGENFELVFRVVRESGEIRHAHVVGQRIDQTTDQPVFRGALQDITARKLAESDLNRARAELARISRVTALSALTASIAHEVNQPLAGIITNANTCLRMLAADPPDIAGATATAQRTIRDGYRASEVITRLRGLFTRQSPKLETVDLVEAAREVLALSASELQRRRIVVRTDFAEGLPAVEGDRIQLQQVFLNLILNAVDAMADTDGRPRKLKVSGRCEPDGCVGFAVSDTGPGFAPEDADRLFQPFHTTKPEGMGIGLSISRSIIEAHGGRLSASPNKPDDGATFAFVLPLAIPRPSLN